MADASRVELRILAAGIRGILHRHGGLAAAGDWSVKAAQEIACYAYTPIADVALDDVERANVVAWLRKVAQARDDRADPEWAAALSEAADAIERGEHSLSTVTVSRKDVGAPCGTGSHASHGAATASPPVGFDPSRKAGSAHG